MKSIDKMLNLYRNTILVPDDDKQDTNALHGIKNWVSILYKLRIVTVGGVIFITLDLF